MALFTGQGKPLKVDFRKLPLNIPVSSVRVRNHSGQSLHELAAKLPPGTETISYAFNYDTESSGIKAGLLLGNITLKIDGSITKRENGTYTLQWEVRSFHDTYDGGAANRGALKELRNSSRAAPLMRFKSTAAKGSGTTLPHPTLQE